MFVRIGGMGNDAVDLKESALLEFLRGGNVNAKGEPKEEVEVFLIMKILNVFIIHSCLKVVLLQIIFIIDYQE